jgi:hypothetical protein
MKKATTLLFALFAVNAWAQTYVQPHVRKDGTYVEGHMRSAPNNTRQDNYSTQGNTNPFTGQSGTVNPYAQPTPSYQQQPQTRQSGYGQQQCGVAANGQYTCR